MNFLVRLVVLVAALPLLFMLAGLVLGSSLFLAGDLLLTVLRAILRF